jgi:hypothetical protein
VVEGWDVPGAAADVGVGVVVGVALVPAGVEPLPAGPLSTTWRSTMPRTTASPTRPAPRTAELTPDPRRPPIPLPEGVAMVTAIPDPRDDLPYGLVGVGCARAARA